MTPFIVEFSNWSATFESIDGVVELECIRRWGDQFPPAQRLGAGWNMKCEEIRQEFSRRMQTLGVLDGERVRVEVDLDNGTLTVLPPPAKEG
jgi:hypothetical protein